MDEAPLVDLLDDEFGEYQEAKIDQTKTFESLI